MHMTVSGCWASIPGLGNSSVDHAMSMQLYESGTSRQQEDLGVHQGKLYLKKHALLAQKKHALLVPSFPITKTTYSFEENSTRSSLILAWKDVFVCLLTFIRDNFDARALRGAGGPVLDVHELQAGYAFMMPH